MARNAASALKTAGFFAYVRVLAEVPVWRSASSQTMPDLVVDLLDRQRLDSRHRVSSSGDGVRQLGMQAVTVISTRSSGELSAATVTVVRAGLLVGKYFAYSSL